MKLSELFERHYAFRRGLIVAELAMVHYVTERSYDYAIYATDKGVTGLDIVAVIGALQAPVLGLLGYTFKLYNDQRCKHDD